MLYLLKLSHHCLHVNGWAKSIYSSKTLAGHKMNPITTLEDFG